MIRLHSAMLKLLIVTLIFAGFEIQDNLASLDKMPSIINRPIQDCWDGNKCHTDSNCGKEGICDYGGTWFIHG